MAGKIIADIIESAGSQISLNVGNITILTASSSGLTLTPTNNVNINVTNSNVTFTTANITTANITTANIASISGAVVATQANQETATSTTTLVTPARQQYHPSAAKVWHFTTYSAGNPALQTSYNVASLSDSGVGSLTVTIDIDFSTVNYAVTLGSTISTSAIGPFDEILTHNTGSWVQRHFENGSLTDPTSVQGIAFGDQ